MERVTSNSSKWQEELETAAVLAVLDEQNKTSTRSCWVREINKKRLKLREFRRLVHELRKRSKTISHVFPNDERRI